MRLGSIVPNFQADSTHGPIQFYNWQGKSWVMLFSHPADFTPVCTSELGNIARNLSEFTKRNVKCLAHSVDNLRSHLLWILDIKAYWSDESRGFPYPIIADPYRDLAVTFGMLDEEQKMDPEIGYITYQTVRALILIDPSHRVRYSIFYPMSTGRSIPEILRCIDSLQLTDRLSVVGTPADWEPSSEVMISTSISDEKADELFPNGYNTISLPSGKNYMRTTQDYEMNI